ncbi:hypothetical protein O181_116046 [Austropuccinia psidii MF-1]|uniref:Uncharacterized protein n=1 Tax=Austropuccinia psidii MF-1 TaxID=1389203 RepID=A0A9Q3K986_9BASI|nr:hypothetical protein [Austropuccinia psidii MF-1]
MLLQFPQYETMMLHHISALTTPSLSSPPLTILMLPRRPQDMPPKPPSTSLRRLPSLPSGTRSIGYSGLLAYMMNAIREICLVAISANSLWGEIGSTFAIPQPLPQTPGNSTEFNEIQNSAPEGGSEISDMVSSHELGIEVESLAHESNPDPPVLQECEHRFILNICSLSKPDTFVIAFISAQPPSSHKQNLKIYEQEKNVEPCAPIEDARQDDVIFSGEVQMISKEQFVSSISQTIPRLKKIQNDSKIPDYVHQKISEAMRLLKMDLNHKCKMCL